MRSHEEILPPVGNTVHVRVHAARVGPRVRYLTAREGEREFRDKKRREEERILCLFGG